MKTGWFGKALAGAALVALAAGPARGAPPFDSFAVPAGSAPHDVAPSPDHANVRQMAGRPGEVWLSESGTDHLLRYRSCPAQAGGE